MAMSKPRIAEIYRNYVVYIICSTNYSPTMVAHLKFMSKSDSLTEKQGLEEVKD